MPDTTTPDTPSAADDDLDAELRLIAGALVAPALPPPEVDDVGFGHAVTRRGTVWRSQVNVPLAVAAVVLLIVGVVALASGGWSENADNTDDADVSSAEPPTDPGLAAPQRLVVGNWFGELPADGGNPTRLPLAGLDPHGTPRFLANGDLVVVGIYPVEEPVPAGFDEMTDLITGLAVVAPDGDVVIERTIPTSSLLGITGTEAILMRSEGETVTGIVAHDLATGAERTISPGTIAGGEPAMAGSTVVANGEVVGVDGWSSFDGRTSDGSNRIEVPEDFPPCTLTRIDLTDGTRTQSEADLECGMILTTQASPDGSQVALVYEAGFGPGVGLRLAVVDIVDGDVAYDEALEPAYSAIWGIAWDDDTTLRLARSSATIAPDWNFDEDDLTADDVLVSEFTVG